MTDRNFDGATLLEARTWLRDRVDDGARCPCCEQMAKVYRRRINAGAAAGLIQLARQYPSEWVHVPTTGTLARLGGEFARLRYWGLVVEEPDLRDDGGRAGWWQITEQGQAFAMNRITLPKYARVYDGRVLGFDASQQVSIVDALGHKFNYRELMEGM
jgi:hypothetical protein